MSSKPWEESIGGDVDIDPDAELANRPPETEPQETLNQVLNE